MGWIWWLLHARPKHGVDWLALIIVFLLIFLPSSVLIAPLLFALLCGLGNLLVFTVWALVKCLIYLMTLLRYGFYICSKRWVIRLPRYRRRKSRCDSKCESHKCEICDTCNDLVKSSRLLTGTGWLFASRGEKHFHHTAEGLRNSAASCHLCALLLNSVHLSSEDSPNQLTVRLEKESVFRQKSALCIWLSGDGILDHIPLTIKENYSGMSRMDTHFVRLLTLCKALNLRNVLQCTAPTH